MKKKNVILLGILLLVAVTSGIVAVTYSRYMTTANGNSSAKIAKWEIKINGEDVTTTNTFSAGEFTWTRLNDAGSVAEGYIAPGYQGETTIELDATNCMVDMDYEISIDPSGMPEILKGKSQFSIVIGDDTVLDIDGGSLTTYNGDITVDSEDKIVRIPVKIIWENNENNNETDTLIGSTIEEITIPVTVTASQYVA